MKVAEDERQNTPLLKTLEGQGATGYITVSRELSQGSHVARGVYRQEKVLLLRSGWMAGFIAEPAPSV